MNLRWLGSCCWSCCRCWSRQIILRPNCQEQVAESVHANLDAFLLHQQQEVLLARAAIDLFLLAALGEQPPGQAFGLDLPVARHGRAHFLSFM